ncbi:glutaminase [Sulfurimonas sp. MAG313]|nr:glutaminase [Sulfurimonas sp. MAG313]MDF1880122.1 glutaminase [Sulfurimonas sp. MAG313]
MPTQDSLDFQKVFSQLSTQIKQLENYGEVASYIPELSKVNPKKFGIHLITSDNQHFDYGDSQEKFSIQSIAKVLSLSMAFRLEGPSLWERVGVEPSGNAFNSLSQLELEHGIPRNPFINAGALLICDVLVSHLNKPKEEFIHFVRKLVGNDTINYCERIALSEKEHGFRNAAMVNFMKSYGNIKNEVHEVLDFYFHLCSIEMSCAQLAQAMSYLSSNGINPLNNEEVVTPSRAKRINAIMQLCGFYDEAGEFSFKVGLPGKSGVGGGIVAIHPEKYTIALWSPRLNAKGNSYRGMKILEFFTTQTKSSIF